MEIYIEIYKGNIYKYTTIYGNIQKYTEKIKEIYAELYEDIRN